MKIDAKLIILLIGLGLCFIFGIHMLFNMIGKNDGNGELNAMVQKTSLDEIWEIEDEYDFIVEMSAYISEKCEYGSNMSKLNADERVFYIAQILEMEVNNGGFSQFFYNSSGDLSNELVASFERIGATKTADICRTAVGAFGEFVPIDRETREELMDDNEEFEEVFSDCDGRFYEYEEDLFALNYRFIINNKTSFME